MKHGEKLRKLRIRKEFSQEYVAQKLGKSQKAYSDLEHKEFIAEEKLAKILIALEVSIEDFDMFNDEFDTLKDSKQKEWENLNHSILKLIKTQTLLIKKVENLDNHVKHLASDRHE